MNEELIEQLKKDLKINSYEGELSVYYQSRLIYSALAEWLRVAVLDEATDDNSSKSKAYLLSRGIAVLSSLVGSSVPLKQWFLEDGKGEHDFSEPVKELRNRMLLAGEYFELLPSHELSIPKSERLIIDNQFDRLIGIADGGFSEQIKYVGITKIIKSAEVKKTYKEYSLKQYMEWILKCASWNVVNSLEKFEFFDAYSKRAPYKSWIDFPTNDEEYYLARMPLYNGLFEYYLFKKSQDGGWSNSILPNWLAERKEERRIILGLRMLCNNKAIAKYRFNGDIVELKLFCRIPIREEVFIETYCWPLRYYMDKLNYVVPFEVWPVIKNKLESNLGMKTEEQ